MQADESTKKLPEIIRSARPMHPLWKWLLPALVLVAGALLYWHFGRKDDRENEPVFKTENIVRGDIDLIVTATGNLTPTNQVTIGSELSGTVSEVLVDINDTVKKDQPIAQLDTAKLTQQTERNRAILLSAEARVTLAMATLTENTASLARYQDLLELSEGKTPSKAQMDTAQAAVDRSKAELESAKAAVNEAQANLRAIERDLSKSVIRSPVDGIVLSRTVEVGQTVAASFTAPVLFVIAEDLRKMDLVVTVAEADIGRVAAGQKASFTVDAWPTRTYHATVQRVAYGSVITNNVVTYNVELGVENSDLSLRPGMTATADISVARATQVLHVPNAALRFDPESVLEFLKKTDPKRTLVQALSPGGGRRWSQSPTIQKPAERSKATSVWFLRDGVPVECQVSVGLTDGRITEVSGEGLREGLPVIISASPPAKP
ncbi:MAG: efflux RND transporter periplasmic adaptor subunit [Verrucomicrobiota bacterium]